MSQAVRSASAEAASEAPYVAFRRTRKTYDGEPLIVSDQNLDSHRAEFPSLRGPSGSGKTTCLMMMRAGFEIPTLAKFASVIR